MLISACGPASAPTSVPPVQTAVTTLPVQPTETQAPSQVTQAPSTAAGEITLDLSGVAQDQTVETVPAVPAGADKPNWEVLPQHRVVTLQGYPVTDHLMKPQIFVYPVAELATYNEAAAGFARDLQALLQSQQPGVVMPFLPMFNASQVFHAQTKFLDFKNGNGVRFLTQFDQAPLPVNSFELIYTFQGLTSDGKYYIAAVLPVTNPDLPATNQVSTEQVSELNDFPAYLEKTVAALEQQPSSSFTPDLAKLDAMIQSMEVK